MLIMFKTTDEYQALAEFTNKQKNLVTLLRHTLEEQNLFTPIHSLVTQLSQQLEEFAKEKRIGSITHKQSQKKLIDTLTQLKEIYMQLNKHSSLQQACDYLIEKIIIMDFPQQNLSLAGILTKCGLLRKEDVSPWIKVPNKAPRISF
jgi:hypothetical protein